jgi:hypothetical protein
MKKRESKRSELMDWSGGTASPHDAIHLPPPFRLVKLRETGDSFAYAQSIASRDGAGTLVYVGRFDVVEFAIVLEPDEPLGLARRCFYAGLNALAEALSIHAPPERPISVTWPDAIYVDGGLVGGARLGWPVGVREDDTPDWIVFGATIRTVCMEKDRSERLPSMEALEDQGFSNMGADPLVTSFSRYLMSNLDAWQSLGFDIIARNYIRRLNSRKGATSSLAFNGDLLLQWRGAPEPERHSLSAALQRPSWLESCEERT